MKVIKTQEEFDSLVVDGLFEIDEDVTFMFNLVTGADIKAWDIKALDIEADSIYARNIKAREIKSFNIYARNIKAGDIDAENIEAIDIKAREIKAIDIKAWNIDADKISYYAVCFAYKDFKCKSVQGRRVNSKHFCLDNEIEYRK